MGKTKLTGILMHLQPERADQLNELAKEMDVRRSELMREAIDDLLVKHKKLKAAKRKP